RRHDLQNTRIVIDHNLDCRPRPHVQLREGYAEGCKLALDLDQWNLVCREPAAPTRPNRPVAVTEAQSRFASARHLTGNSSAREARSDQGGAPVGRIAL